MFNRSRQIRCVDDVDATMYVRAASACLILCCAWAIPVAAQPLSGAVRSGDTLSLTLAAVRQLAVRANKDLGAARLDTAIARGELRQAGVPRFNPSADVLGASRGNGLEAGISQEIEVFGQRGRRVAAGKAGFDRSRARVADAMRRVLGDVDRAFYRLAAANRRFALAREVLTLNERLATVANRQLESGEISRLDYNLAVVELGRSRSRLLAARREEQRVAIELALLAGLPTGAPITPLLDSTQHPPLTDTVTRAHVGDTTSLSARARALDADSLVALALAGRPDLSERQSALRQANAQEGVTRREALPNIVLRGTTEPSASGTGRSLRPGAGLAIPLFNRNQGELAARRAAVRRAELEQLAQVARVRAEVTSAVATYQSAAIEVEVLETTVLLPARQNRQLLETAYREGEVGLPVLLLIRNQVIDAELEYWTTWLAEREARATLDESTGENVRGSSPSPSSPGGAR